MVWIICALLTLATILIVARPLMRPSAALVAAIPESRLYRQQIADIERDVDLGLIDPDQAEALRLEVKRRLLNAAEREHTPPPAQATSRKGLALFLAIAIGLSAFGFYGLTGSPDLPDQPFEERLIARLDMPRDQARRMIGMVENLAEKLRAQPANIEGWLMLARSYLTLGQPDEAADAYRQAIAHGAASPELFAALGEILTMINGGQVIPEARDAFAKALALDAQDPRARYYHGLGLAQQGKIQQALAIWQDLRKDSKPDAPWLAALNARIAEFSAQNR